MLEDYKINVKLKLAALWTSIVFLYIYGDYFELYVPRKAEGLVNGINMLDSPLKLLMAAIMLAISSLMIFLSVALKSKLNRVLNITVGLFFTALMLLIAATSYTPWRSFYVLYALMESVLTSLVVWYAIKWPKQVS
jgi:hypothetical protein